MKRIKKMKAQQSSKPISTKELKFWLEGFLEFQEDDWVPNAEQWKKIQDKIFNLEDDTRLLISPVSAMEPNMPQRLAPERSNVFTGGAAGQPASYFPSDKPPVLPVVNAQGFYEMPENNGPTEIHNTASSVSRQAVLDEFK